MSWIIDLFAAFMPLVLAYIFPVFCIFAVVFLILLAASLLGR